MLAFLIISFVLLVIYSYIVWNNEYWERKKVPHEKPTFFVGNLKAVLTGSKHFGVVYDELYRKFENSLYIGYYKLREPAILIRDPELVKNVLVKDFNHFANNDIQVDPNIEPILHTNIFTQNGDEWKKNRSAWSQGLTTSKIKAMYDNSNVNCDSMIKHLKHYIKKQPDEPMEARNLFSNFFTGNIVTNVFGLKINSFEMEDNPYKKVISSFFLPNFWDGIKTLSFIFAPWLSTVLKIRLVPKTIENSLMKMAKDILDSRKDTGFQKNNPFDSILHSENKDKKNFEIECAGLIFSFLIDGTETSSGVAGFVLHALSANPDIQNKLREEIKNATKDKPLSYDEIHQLPYLDMVISETLRLYPPALAIQRICTKPYVMPPPYPGGEPLQIDVGMPITIPVYAIQRNSEYFPDPEMFIPERFAEENKWRINKFTFLPFGDGPRICIGARLALNQLKIGLVGILKNFEIRLAPKSKHKAIAIDPNVLIFRNVGDIWITLHGLDE